MACLMFNMASDLSLLSKLISKLIFPSLSSSLSHWLVWSLKKQPSSFWGMSPSKKVNVGSWACLSMIASLLIGEIFLRQDSICLWCHEGRIYLRSAEPTGWHLLKFSWVWPCVSASSFRVCCLHGSFTMPSPGQTRLQDSNNVQYY